MAKSIIGDIVALGDGFGGTGTATDPISVDSSEINTSDLNNDAGFITGVTHDSTITGDGSSDASKLSVKEMVGSKVMTYAPAVLGGVEYAGHKVGNQLWTGHIAYQTTNATWYKNDKSTYEAYGMYYTFSDVSIINSLLTDGWRVPTGNDINVLVNTVGSSNYKKLLSSADNGTDDYGLGWRLGGYDSSWMGSRARYRSSVSGDVGMFISGSLSYNDNSSGISPTNIVLVKDIVADTDGTKGLVPQPKIADVNKYLRGDGTWSAVNVPSKTSDLTNDSNFITDAPDDGKQYARQSKSWQEVQSSGGGGIVYPAGNYGLGEWGHRTCAQKDEPDQKAFHGNRTWILDWRPYLIDMTAVEGETTKTPVAELKRSNWLRKIDGSYASVVGITSAQSTACDKDLYWTADGANQLASSFFDDGKFLPATFWEYCKENLATINSTYGKSYTCAIEVKLYTIDGTELSYGSYTANHIVAPWETTSTMLSVFIGRQKDCYLFDGVVGNSGKRWHGITESAAEFDGIDPSEFKLARTGMSPGPVTGKYVNSKWVTRSYFYNYPAGTTWNAGADMSAACNGENQADCNTSYKYCSAFFNNGHYPWVECTWNGNGYGGGSGSSSYQNSEQYNPNAYTAQKYNRQNNYSVNSPAPVAEGGFHMFNTFMNTVETGYGTKYLHRNTMFSSGVSSDFDCVDEESYLLNGGIKYTSGSTTYYKKWNDSSNVNSSYNWSDAVNSYKGKFQCMEPQIALSIAVEMGVQPGTSFTWNGGVWRYEIATPVSDTYSIVSPLDGEMNARVYKVASFTYNSITYYMNLVCGLVQGVNYGGDIWSYWQGGIEIVANPVLATTSHKSSNDRIDVFLENDQASWHTEDLGTYSASWWYRSFGTFFGFESTYRKVATGESYGGYTRDRAPYAPIALEYIAGFNPDGDAVQVGWSRGECYYANQKYDDLGTTGVNGYHTRRAVRFRGAANGASCSPRCLIAHNRASYVGVSHACSAQVLLAQPE